MGENMAETAPHFDVLPPAPRVRPQVIRKGWVLPPLHRRLAALLKRALPAVSSEEDQQ